MEQTLKDLIAGTHELAALPQTTARLLELLESQPDAEIAPLLRVIELDPGLTANMLKLCNSAYYGRKREVGTVGEALDLLGTRTVTTLAFAASMGRIMRAPLAGYGLARDELWRHNLAVACGAATIATDEAQGVSRDRAFTAGMLHDVGKLLLDRILARRLEWEPLPDGERDWPEIERQVAGFDHAEAGAALADHWRFPMTLVEAIRWHHEPGQATAVPVLARAVHAADVVATALGAFVVGDDARAVPDPVLAGDLGVAPEILRHVVALLPGQLAEMTGLFGGRPASALTAPAGRW